MLLEEDDAEDRVLFSVGTTEEEESDSYLPGRSAMLWCAVALPLLGFAGLFPPKRNGQGCPQ